MTIKNEELLVIAKAADYLRHWERAPESVELGTRLNELVKKLCNQLEKGRDSARTAMAKKRKNNPNYGGGDFYQQRKTAARQEAIDWRLDYSNHNYSAEELDEFNDYFKKLAKQFGLQKEFKDNGII